MLKSNPAKKMGIETFLPCCHHVYRSLQAIMNMPCGASCSFPPPSGTTSADVPRGATRASSCSTCHRLIPPSSPVIFVDLDYGTFLTFTRTFNVRLFHAYDSTTRCRETRTLLPNASIFVISDTLATAVVRLVAQGVEVRGVGEGKSQSELVDRYMHDRAAATMMDPQPPGLC